METDGWIPQIMLKRWLVTIRYREPTYELSRDNVRRLHPYSACYDIEARDEAAAERLAREAFQRASVISSSGWVRVIESVDVRAIDEDTVTRLAGEPEPEGDV